MQRKDRVTKRFYAIMNMMEPCQTIADIGSDHGKLASYVLMEGICQQVITTDCSEHSLQKARNLFANHPNETKVSFRIGDGLSVLEQGEAQGIVIAGMGGQLIASLLDKEQAIVQTASWLILQPMQQVSCLRAYLNHSSWAIVEEDLIFEENRYYDVIKIRPNLHNEKKENSAFFDEFGHCLWEEHHPLLLKKIEHTSNVLQKKMNMIDAQAKQTQRANECRDVLYSQWIQCQQALQKWEEKE